MMSRTTHLDGLAAALGQDRGLRVSIVAGQSFSCNVQTGEVHLGADALAEVGEAAACGAVLHEVGHYRITRCVRPSGPVWDQLGDQGASFLLNALEDPRVNTWATSFWPGSAPMLAALYAWAMTRSVQSPSLFLTFCVAAAQEWATGWTPTTNPIDLTVREALTATRAARRDLAALQPLGSRSEASHSHRLIDVSPRGDTSEAPIIAAQAQVIAQAAPVAEIALELLQLDRARGIFSDNGPGEKSRSVGDLGSSLEGSDEQAGMAIEIDRMSQEVGRLPVIPSQSSRGEEAVSAPEQVPQREWLPPPPITRSPVDDPLGTYEEIMRGLQEPIQRLHQVMSEAFPPQSVHRPLRDRVGVRLALSQAMRRAAPGGHRIEDLWLRRAHPGRRRAVVGVLLDASGSMRGDRAAAAQAGAVLLIESVTRLDGIRLLVAAFQDELISLQDLVATGGLSTSAATRRAIAHYPLETRGMAPGGHNQPAWNDDGPCIAEIAKQLEAEPADDRLLIVLSDGLPEGRHSTESDLQEAISAIQSRGRVKLVGLGLGPATHGMKRLYPIAQTGLMPEEIPAALASLLAGIAQP